MGGHPVWGLLATLAMKLARATAIWLNPWGPLSMGRKWLLYGVNSPLAWEYTGSGGVWAIQVPMCGTALKHGGHKGFCLVCYSLNAWESQQAGGLACE